MTKNQFYPAIRLTAIDISFASPKRTFPVQSCRSLREIMWRTFSASAFMLTYFISLCFSKVTESAVDSWEFHRPTLIFNPPETTGLITGERKRVYFSIVESNQTATVSDEFREATLSVGIVVTAEKPDIVQISENATSILCLRSGSIVNNHSFEIEGVLLGYSKLYFDLYPLVGKCLDAEFLNYQHPDDWYEHQNTKNGSSNVVYNYEYLVSVVPTPSLLADIFTGVMALLVAINYVNMGCQLDLPSILQVLKRPVGPAIGFVCQFAFMPLASYGIGYVMFDDINLRLGLFTLGCSPGGSMSNFWTLLFDGDLNLSVTMTFISTIAALGMMPLWIFTLGAYLFRKGKVTLPYVNLAGSLISLTLPMGIGMIIRKCKPTWAKFSEKIIRPSTILCIIIAISVGSYISSYIFLLFTWKIVAAGLAVAWGGYCFGALAALLAGMGRPQIIAVAIETAFQNGGIAFVMLLLSLPQPDAGLTSVPVLAQLIVTGAPMWIILAVVKTISCINGCREKKKAPSGAADTKLQKEVITEKETNL